MSDDTRMDLQPGIKVVNGKRKGQVVERLTSRRSGHPHREIHVLYPDGSTSIHVNEERDHLRPC